MFPYVLCWAIWEARRKSQLVRAAVSGRPMFAGCRLIQILDHQITNRDAANSLNSEPTAGIFTVLNLES
jgi:hypothetical protein